MSAIAPNGIEFRRAIAPDERKAAESFALYFSGNPGCDAQSSLSLPALFERVGHKLVWICGYDDGLLVLALAFLPHPRTFPGIHTLAISLSAAPGYDTVQNIRNIVACEQTEIEFPGCCENRGAAYFPETTAERLKPILEDLFLDSVWSDPDDHGMVTYVGVMPSDPLGLA